MSQASSSSNSDDKNSLKKRLNDTHLNQIQVLRALGGLRACTRTAHKIMASVYEACLADPREYKIQEIAELSGLNDEKEVQRYLFILEGQKLVTPLPIGDFTSKTWQITKYGLQMLQTIQRRALPE